LFVFSHDGHSRPIASGARWAVSQKSRESSDYIFAVGTEGSIREQEVILRIYDGKRLLVDTESRLGEFAAYEGVVTAVAFAKEHRQIAFCVRERASHRLYLADPNNLDPSAFVLVDEQEYRSPYLVEADSRNRDQRMGGPPGITCLEFSPDDGLLVAHGLYDSQKYRLSMWQLDWRQDDTPTSSGGRQAVRVQKTYDPWIPDRGPVLQEHGSQSIHFIHRKSSDKKSDSAGLRMGVSSTSSGDVVVFETTAGLQVVNLRTKAVLREVPFVATQWGSPEYHITDDGRWVIMGDDNGTIDIFDLIEGEKISLTVDGRPAHAGPVVGVTLSQPDPALGFPAYAATVGEENQLKVWDLILPMTTAEASTSLPKTVIESRDNSRRSR
jgi:WD40 repeat protein